MPDSLAAVPQQIIKAAPIEGVTMKLVRTEITIYYLTADALENLSSSGIKGSILLTVTGIAAGCFGSFWTTLETATLPSNLNAIFVALVFASVFLSLVFGVLTFFELRVSRRLVKRIKEKPIVTPVL